MFCKHFSPFIDQLKEHLLLFQTRLEAQALVLKSWHKTTVTTCLIASDGAWLGTMLVSSPATDKTWEQTSPPCCLLPALPPGVSRSLCSGMQCVEEVELLESLLQGVFFKCEGSTGVLCHCPHPHPPLPIPSPKAQPISGAGQSCAPRTDTIAKQIVILSRGGVGRGDSGSPNWEVFSTGGGWAGGPLI